MAPCTGTAHTACTVNNLHREEVVLWVVGEVGSGGALGGGREMCFIVGEGVGIGSVAGKRGKRGSVLVEGNKLGFLKTVQSECDAMGCGGVGACGQLSRWATAVSAGVGGWTEPLVPGALTPSSR